VRKQSKGVSNGNQRCTVLSPILMGEGKHYQGQAKQATGVARVGVTHGGCTCEETSCGGKKKKETDFEKVWGVAWPKSGEPTGPMNGRVELEKPQSSWGEKSSTDTCLGVATRIFVTSEVTVNLQGRQGKGRVEEKPPSHAVSPPQRTID